MQDWILAQAAAGVIFLMVCCARRRMHLWPVVAAFLIGNLLRTLGANESGAVNPGPLGIAYAGNIPFEVGILLQGIYASFVLVPLAILAFADDRRAQLAGVVVILDGLIHLLLPVKPPWMVGESQRWIVESGIAGSAVARDINPVAALPSLHVALPASQGWLGYTVAMSAAVFLLGEHWVIDAVAAWLLVYVAVKLVHWARSHHLRVPATRTQRGSAEPA